MSEAQPGLIDIWTIPLRIDDASQVGAWRQCLTPDEVERADVRLSGAISLRFIISRAWTRSILGGYLRTAPAELVLTRLQGGKPVLDPPVLYFNLAHSEELAVLAVACDGPIGIDVEAIRPRLATGRVPEQFFGPGEVARLRALPVADQARAFFDCWTRKEAFIKCLGEGLRVPLDSFEVEFGPGSEARLLWSRSGPSDARFWMADVSAYTGDHAAAVVARFPFAVRAGRGADTGS